MNTKMFLTPLLTILLFAACSTNPCFSLELGEIGYYEDLFAIETEKTISLDFTNANLNDVLKIFSQQSGMNFIAATDIATKKVNLYLDQVPVTEAIERILSANNLSYEIDPGSNIFVVNEIPTDDTQLMTRVYPLRFATVPSSKLNETLDFDDDDDTGAADSSSGGIIGAISAILTENGSVVEDTRTNSIVVSDIPSHFPIIEQTVARLDVRVPQILIEVEMLDISKNTADLMGAKFGDTPVTFTGAERDVLFPFNQNEAIRNLGKSGNQGFTFEGQGDEYRVGTLSFQGLSVTLQFLRTKTDTKSLARPRILTLNNVTAEISIKTNEAIGLASNTTSSEGTSTSVAEAERADTGIFLKVTPQANIHTREITMAIEPKVIEAKTGATFGGETFKDPQERGSKSIVRVRDGDTIVLGGLLGTTQSNTQTKVPILGKIPILGGAFRHKDNTETQRELIIFITPHIITEDTALSTSITGSGQREQSAPQKKNSVIDKELSSMEEKRFDSYR